MNEDKNEKYQKRMQRIYANNETQKSIAEKFECQPRTVRFALNEERTTKRYKEICSYVDKLPLLEKNKEENEPKSNDSASLVKYFNDKPVKFLQLNKSDDELFLTAEELGTALGFSEPRKAIIQIYKRNKDILKEFTCDVKLISKNGQRQTKAFSETGIFILCIKSEMPVAKKFQKFAAQVVREFRRGNYRPKFLRVTAAILNVLKESLDPDLYMLYMKDLTGLQFPPDVIIRKRLKAMDVKITEIAKEFGCSSRMEFLLKCNMGTIENKEKIASYLGLSIKDIW